MTIKERKARAKKAKQLMENNKIKDDKHLRSILTDKFVWAMNEKKKGMNLIQQTNAQVLRLEGIIIFINDILKPKKEEK